MQSLLTLLFVLLSAHPADFSRMGRENNAAPAGANSMAHASRRVSMGPGWILYVPSSFRLADDGAYDLLIHFHGVPQTVEKQFEETGINGLLVTVNLGNGGLRYREHFPDAASWDRSLAFVEQTVAEQFPRKNTHARRIALSAWSAGHGAALEILADAKHRERIDTVLIADGLHGTFTRGHERERTIFPESIEPFMAYAKMAADGDRLMVVTHSAILTPDYASTSETAAYMVHELGLGERAPRAAAGGETKQHEGRGNLTILGLAGNDAPAHGVHLKQMRDLTLEPLAKRWR